MLKIAKINDFFFLSFLSFSWCIDTFLTFFWSSNSFPLFLFLDQIRTILLMMVDDKGRRDSRREVRHHVVGDYNFLTQKKNIFLKITFCPPPTLCSVLWIQQCTYGYVQFTYDNFNIKKNFVFWSWQPTMTTC
jgi:hypothetical protein